MSRTRGPSATYVYCVAHAPRAPDLARAPRGLPGAGRARVVDLGRSLWLVVADAPLERYGQQAVERGMRDLDWVAACAAGHQRVVEHVARSCTAIPMTLLTLFSSDERAADHVTAQRARVERAARRVAGCLEWGLRVHVDERRAREAARRQAAGALRRARSGKSFLLLKKAEHHVVADTLRSARRDAGRAFSALRARARDAAKRPAVTRELRSRVLLDAVFLVPVAGTRDFQAEVERAAASLHESGCSVTLTGPWPAYSFVGARRRGGR